MQKNKRQQGFRPKVNKIPNLEKINLDFLALISSNQDLYAVSKFVLQFKLADFKGEKLNLCESLENAGNKI